MDLTNTRDDFPILNRKIGGNTLTYFDNAATSLKPTQVVEAEKKYYETECANVHRGLHVLSESASRVYEQSHEVVGKFLGAKKEEVCFVKNTTEGINLVMYSLLNSNYFKKGDKIVISALEHHSNIVPWQYLSNKIGTKLEFVELTDNFEIDMNDFEKKVNGAKLVSFSGASNTVATLPDIRTIEKKSHKEGALFCVDGAQMVPHKKINFKEMNADFFAFSGHKMLAPTGTGALVAKKELLQKLEPFMLGGDMIMEVKRESSSWNELPYKYEAGTPNIAGAYGMIEAIKYLEKVGLNNIEKHEQELTKQTLDLLGEMKEIDLFCPKDAKKQGGIVLFGSKKVSAHDIAMALSENESICIRSGMHCAEPLVSSLNKDGLARASFYFYNTSEEVEKFTKALKEVINIFG